MANGCPELTSLGIAEVLSSSSCVSGPVGALSFHPQSWSCSQDDVTFLNLTSPPSFGIFILLRPDLHLSIPCLRLSFVHCFVSSCPPSLSPN